MVLLRVSSSSASELDSCFVRLLFKPSSTTTPGIVALILSQLRSLFSCAFFAQATKNLKMEIPE